MFRPVCVAVALLACGPQSWAESPEPPPAPPRVSVGLGKGITVASADDRYSMNIRARFVPRFDVTIPAPNDEGRIEPKSRVALSTARFWVQGHLFSPRFQYVFQLAFGARDFRDGTISPIYDAFVDWKAHRDASLKVGQFFVPFDRLRTVREFALQMTDRPRAVAELTLDRDIGVVLYSDHLGGDRSPVAYRVGVFGGNGPNGLVAKTPGALFVGRAELRPLGEIDDDSEGDLENRAAPKLALGVAAAYNLNTNRQRSTTGATFTGGTADYLHVAADMVFKVQGFALQGEYLYRRAGEDEVATVGEGDAAATEWARSGQGWVAQASYHFRPGVELVARGAQTLALPGTDPALVSEVEAKGHEVGAGLNWYRNGHRFKVQTTWIALFGDDFAAAEHLVATQVDMMF